MPLLPPMPPPTDACEESSEEALVIKAGTVAEKWRSNIRTWIHEKSKIAIANYITSKRSGKRNA